MYVSAVTSKVFGQVYIAFTTNHRCRFLTHAAENIMQLTYEDPNTKEGF